MTQEEVDKYLNQVAFSGAEEFVKKYKGQNQENIIGKFGLVSIVLLWLVKGLKFIQKALKMHPPLIGVGW